GTRVATIGVEPGPLALRRVEVEAKSRTARLEEIPNLEQSRHIRYDAAVVHVPLVVDGIERVDLVNQGHDPATEVEGAKWVALLHASLGLDDVLVIVQQHRGGP